MNLLFCGNSGVFDGITTALLSLMLRSRIDSPVRVYIFTMDLRELDEKYTPVTKEQCQALEGLMRKYAPFSQIILKDVTALYREHFAGCPNEDAYCSPYTLIRLFADLVIDEDKLLYLDADVLFNRGAELLYNVDVEGYEYAAAGDHYGKYLIRYDYINAGVLLFNMKCARETGLFEKARNEIKKKKLVFADQSAIIRATTRKKLLPVRFNDQKFLHKNTVVRHFSKRLFWLPYPHTDNVKPWHVERVHQIFRYRQFDDIFEQYISFKEHLL